uniref:FAE domain-containing protein n=1 Tax=Ananas comosus var. bracteatus TaxID=296719 RepID=A0A6V7QVD8_ANACO
MYLLLIPLLAVAAAHLSSPSSLRVLHALWAQLRLNLLSAVLCSAALCFCTPLLPHPPRPVFLVDFSCYKPGDAWRCTRERFMQCTKSIASFTEENIEFQRKIIEKSGLGDSTYLPGSVLDIPGNPSMKEARKEAEMVMFGALDELFAKTSVKPKDIGILVVNCSLFNPTPSLSAMIVNRFKLRGNIRSYNLGGMGCSASVIAVDLAKDLLQAHPSTYAVVV